MGLRRIFLRYDARRIKLDREATSLNNSTETRFRETNWNSQILPYPLESIENCCTKYYSIEYVDHIANSTHNRKQ